MSDINETERETGLLQRVLDGLRRDEHLIMGVTGQQKLVDVLAGIGEPLRTELVREILTAYLDDVIDLVKAMRSTRNDMSIAHNVDSAPYHAQQGENVAFHMVINALEFQKKGLR